MFNIAGFSDINSRYGNDTGDWLLVRTVDILNQVFKNSRIYRTGSDEFIVAFQVNSAERKTGDILLCLLNGFIVISLFLYTDEIAKSAGSTYVQQS